MFDAPSLDEKEEAMDEKDVILSNGLKVHYYEWPGSKPALIFLHPSSGYGRMWEATANHLGSRFHIYAIDQRGHGSSGRPDGDYSAEEYADDLRLFLTSVGVDKAILAGQSLGGRVGIVFAAVHPERTLGLALVGGPHLSNFYPTREACSACWRRHSGCWSPRPSSPRRTRPSRICASCGLAIVRRRSAIASSTTWLRPAPVGP